MRFWEIDFARGIAICMMALFHFLWDLNYFGVVSLSLYTGFWGIFQKATASLFLLLGGIVLAVSYFKNRDNYMRKFLLRGAFIFGLGMIITAATLFFYPEQAIYFGVLHLIGVSVILSVPFVKRKWAALAGAAAFIILPVIYPLASLNVQMLWWMGFAPSVPTLDFFPLFPWFGVVLFGAFLGSEFYGNAERKFMLAEQGENTLSELLQLLGRHSIIIYFSHQFVLFPLAYLISLV